VSALDRGDGLLPIDSTDIHLNQSVRWNKCRTPKPFWSRRRPVELTDNRDSCRRITFAFAGNFNKDKGRDGNTTGTLVSAWNGCIVDEHPRRKTRHRPDTRVHRSDLYQRSAGHASVPSGGETRRRNRNWPTVRLATIDPQSAAIS